MRSLLRLLALCSLLPALGSLLLAQPASTPVTTHPNTGVLKTPANFFTASGVPQLSVANTFTHAAQVAPSWRLPAYGGTATLPVGNYGIGWDENGRFTIQTPAGALQLYATGTPSVPTIYWPGNIVSQSLTSVNTATLISAANITTGAGGDALNASVMTNSLLAPLRQWQGTTSAAGTVGIPTQSDSEGVGGTTELVDGTYWPQTVVTGMTGQTSIPAGRYRTTAQARADLAAPEIVAVPATASSTGTAGQIAYDASYFYVCIGTNTWRRTALSTW